MHRAYGVQKNEKLDFTTTVQPELPDIIGGNILKLITSGMYTTPLCIYREYIQNAADSIASSDQRENGRVEVNIHVDSMRLSIRDNGPGLTHSQAIKELLPIARSSKHNRYNRGFRGIGRLSGLAFGESVTFLTRHKDTDPVTRIVWSGPNLMNGIDGGLSAEKTVSTYVTVDTINGDPYPAQFFEVQIDGISRYAASYLLNRELVREYIGEVCTVPFSENFPYSERLLDLFEEGEKPFTLEVLIDGQEPPVTRPHGNEVCFSGKYSYSFVDFEEIFIPALGGEGQAAIGWMAHLPYYGALPRKPGIRCMRARAGNIQIGDENVFDHLFSESRFNRWCVSEIHILDPRIIPNGRRDYFEPNPHLRNLENRLSAICRGLERKCRDASGKRNEKRRFLCFLESVDVAYELSISGYLSTEAAKKLIAEKLSNIEALLRKHEKLNGLHNEVQMLEELKEKLINFKAKRGKTSFLGIAPPEVSTYRNIFQVLVEVSESPQEAKEIIEAILSQTQNRADLRQG